MDDQNDLGAKDNAISRQSPEPNPIAIIAKPKKTTIFSNIFASIKQNPIKSVFISLALLVALASLIANVFEIPNSVMSWFINWNTLHNSRREDVKQLKALSESNSAAETVNEMDNVDYPGLGFHAVLRLNEIIPNRKNYIFDCGESFESNRISLYILPDRTLFLEVIDQDENPHFIKVKPHFETFEFHSLIYLACDFGNAGNQSFLRIVVNGRQVGFQTFSDLGNFTPTVGMVQHCVVGADIEHKNGSAIMIEMVAIPSAALSRKMSNAMLGDVDQLLSEIKNGEVGFILKGNGGVDCGQPYAKAFGEWDWGSGLFGMTNGLIPSLGSARVWLF